MFKNTNIYSPPNSNRSFDPLDVRRKLIIHTNGELTKLIDLYNDGDELNKAIAEDRLILATRKTFGLPPLSEQNGFSDETVLEYLAHFLEWLSKPSEINTNSIPKSHPCVGCR